MPTDKVTILSPAAKAIFPNLLKHEEFNGEIKGKGQYSLTLVFDKADIKPIEKAIAQAGGGKGASPLKHIGDDEKYDAGKYRLKAHTTFAVKVVNKSKESIGVDRISQGSEVRVWLTFEPYQGFGGGVTTYLGPIQLLKEGGLGDMDFGDLPEGYEPGADFDDELPF